MKSLQVLLEEIKAKDGKVFAVIEKQIKDHATAMGIQLEAKKTEHPPKPPVHP